MDALIVPTPDRNLRLIAGRGTREEAWSSCSKLNGLRELDVDGLARDHGRIHLVSPHPDDEVLGLGGLLARWPMDGAAIRIVSVTHGTASHPGSTQWTAERLAMTRPFEMRRALRTLGSSAVVSSVGIEDGTVAAHEDRLASWLAERCESDDLIVAPWRLDGHPDHEACGRAAARAAESCGARFAEYPIWAWPWARPAERLWPWRRARRINLDAQTVERKRAAIRAFTSQITRDGRRDAVLPPHVVRRFERPFELLFLGR